MLEYTAKCPEVTHLSSYLSRKVSEPELSKRSQH
jgi:hypothetical protein